MNKEKGFICLFILALPILGIGDIQLYEKHNIETGLIFQFVSLLLAVTAYLYTDTTQLIGKERKKLPVYLRLLGLCLFVISDYALYLRHHGNVGIILQVICIFFVFFVSLLMDKEVD